MNKKRLAVAVTVAMLSMPVNSALAAVDQVSSVPAQVTPGDSTLNSLDTGVTLPAISPIDSTTSNANTNTSPNNDASEQTNGQTDGTSNGEKTDSTELPPMQDSNGQPFSQGAKPGTAMYWLTNLIQKLQVALTFNPVHKAAIVDRQACQKLATAEQLIKEGKLEEAQKLLEEYTNKITQAQNFLNKVKDPNSEEYQALIKALATKNTHNIKALGALLEKLPPQAAQKVALNVVRTMEKAIDEMDKVGDKAKSGEEISTGDNTDKVSNSDNTTSSDNVTTPEDNSHANAPDAGSSVANPSSQTEDIKRLQEMAKKALAEFEKTLLNKELMAVKADKSTKPAETIRAVIPTESAKSAEPAQTVGQLPQASTVTAQSEIQKGVKQSRPASPAQSTTKAVDNNYLIDRQEKANHSKIDSKIEDKESREDKGRSDKDQRSHENDKRQGT